MTKDQPFMEPMVSLFGYLSSLSSFAIDQQTRLALVITPNKMVVYKEKNGEQC